MRTDSPFVKARLAEIRERIATAALGAGRGGAEITVVAVTKYLAAEQMTELRSAGLEIFGESRAQDALPKLDFLDARPAVAPREWHFIGTLQGNKVRSVVGRFALIHSVDRLETARRVSQTALELGIVQRALLQVRVSNEETKHGFAANELEAAWPELATLPGLRIEGLMGMAAAAGDPRPAFRALRQLGERLDPEARMLRHLSMGMSGDYEAAVAEGASLLRIGTLLFSEEAGA